MNEVQRLKKPKNILKVIFFSPIAKLVKWVYFLRRAFYDYGIFRQYSFYVPIISVGNLNLGGTGKTPFTLWLSQYLNARRKKVMILTRGYKGKLEHKSGILFAGKKINPNPEDYGDEPLMLARRLEDASIVVGKKRALNLKYYFPKVEPDVVILDDGHQHLSLKRKLNIVLFDATMPIHLYELAPLGYMREGFSGLKDADLIVIGRADLAGPLQTEKLKMLLRPHLPYSVEMVETGYRPTGFYNSTNDLVFNLSGIEGKKVILIAGIADPKSFFQMVEDLGALVLVTEAFPDHHYFKKEEIEALLSYAKNEDAFIVTTEKDIVRMRNVIEDESILYMQIELFFINGEDKASAIIDQACMLGHEEMSPHPRN